MSTLMEQDVSGLRERLSGQLITAADPEYDTAREVWNGSVDRRPLLIARCAGPGDVALALGFARETGLEIAVRGGGHNFGGAAVCDDGLVVDLTAMRGISVDEQHRRVRCGGGTTMADLDAATCAQGLAVPAGTISHTGIGGLALGGGFGWLTHEHGLSCDNLISAEVVTVGGDVLRASRDEHADLFWALRGGGGNFGVVTEFEFRAHPMPPLVRMGLFFWGLDDGVAALRVAREVTEDLPAGMGAMIAGLNAPPAEFVPPQHRLVPGYALIVAGFGPEREHEALLRAVRAELPPLFEFVTPMPFPDLQRMLDDAAPWGILAYEKAVYLERLSDEVIEVITGRMPEKRSAMSFLPIFPVGGAFRAVDEDATAFGGSRRTGVIFNAAALAPDPDLVAEDRTWSRTMCDALAPHAINQGTYVNFMNDYDDSDRVRNAFGPDKYRRLAGIKAEYDPENLLHRNPNIKPAGF
ncbi:FAD-binding oxidoreductase [Saccharopolyspora taberi]|uniref:FAD-binding oxidoreductase n=1 Tax=Saccharopolyspora taberi TaxID=60895 RepID=A0ABN3VI57_9PSEU